MLAFDLKKINQINVTNLSHWENSVFKYVIKHNFLITELICNVYFYLFLVSMFYFYSSWNSSLKLLGI